MLCSVSVGAGPKLRSLHNSRHRKRAHHRPDVNMPKPPARVVRRRLPRDERISKIMAVTRTMLNEKGYDNIVTAEVAERCGISEATIYKYFDSKRDLLIQVAMQYFEELLREGRPDLAGRGALESLRMVVWRSLSVVRREPAMTRFVLLDLRPDPAYRAMPIFELNRRFTAQVTEVLQEGMRTGELRSDVPVRLLRDMIFGCIEHQTWAFLRGEGDFSVDEVTEGIVTVIIRGMVTVRAADSDPPGPDLGDTVARLERVAARLEQAGGVQATRPARQR
jgi:TetR/AcrR family fatty acid metabolism transcriptional regulator